MSKNIVVVVDIDGTIAKVGDRLKYLQREKRIGMRSMSIVTRMSLSRICVG